jgi:peptidoglycan/LPS O-acetylase OafA/YrhL
LRGLRNLAFGVIAIAYAKLVVLAHQQASMLPRLHGASPIDLPWVNSFVQFQFFAAGTLIAIFLHTRPWAISWYARVGLLIGGPALMVLVDLTLHPSQPGIPALHLCAGYLGLLLGTVAIFLAFLNAPIRPPQALVYLGRISFGLYVFHFFVINFGVLVFKRLQQLGMHLPFLLVFEPAILLVTIAAAAISYRFFEQPILRLKERFAYVRTVA